VIIEMWPDRFGAEQVADDVRLGADGLGLDSVEIAELLFACEEVTGTTMKADLLENGPLTIGRIVDYFGLR
jgi:acyl carrier protein